MAALARRIALVVAVIVTFVALQTGWARAIEDVCADEGEASMAGDEAVPCAPSCADCRGCAGPTRALIGARPAALLAATHALVLDVAVIELVGERDADRIDRPPRA